METKMHAFLGETWRWTHRLGRTCVLAGVLATIPAATLAAEGANVDELFEQARELGFAGQRQEARDICTRILERSPDYHDVRVFLGRLYAWDKMYKPARSAFRRVLDARPDHLDARLALIDVQQWSRRPKAGLE